MNNRKVEWPHPAPTGHQDVEKWDSMWLNNICLGNPQNHERERTYWEKCFQWKVDDPRLSESATPCDMFTLDALIREKIKKVAEGIQGNVLYERMQAEENAWWATTHRILSARKYMAMYYENFRIANVEVRAMYMKEFPHIHYDTYGDKAAAKWWEVFKRGAANMSGIMTVEGLTEHLVSQLGESKHLSQDLCKEIRKEPDPKKWDYGDIGNKINLKLDEKFTLEKTKKQREEHTAKIIEQHTGKPSGPRKSNATTKDIKKG